MNAPLRIVLDTNVLIAAIGTQSPLRWLFDALLDQTFTLCLSTPILLEYEAVLTRKASPVVARNVVSLLEVAPNVERVVPRYRWRLIPSDPDDNKFVDAALAAGAHALVTHDKHFGVLETIGFPPLPVWSAAEFQQRLREAS